MVLFSSGAGKQVIHVGKVELESVVPNSDPERFINIRGGTLTGRGADMNHPYRRTH